MVNKLLLATNNKAKITEYQNLLATLPLKLVTPADLGITTEVYEGSADLEENARLKATVFGARSRLMALADDTGLEVDFLGGEPGPLSARYAGEGASDEERVAYLLSKLQGVPWEQRTARFRCVIAIVMPGGEVEVCSGERKGFITLAPEGVYGFGYDPVFYLPELGKTMAELPMEIKNQVSHRGQAARKAYQILEKLMS